MKTERNNLLATLPDLAQQLLSELNRIDFDTAHGVEHALNVLHFASRLQQEYGGNEKVVLSAALLHDLGRSNPDLHGWDSRALSMKLARPILERAGLSDDEVEGVIEAICDHDQPGREPVSIEGKILSDADFLDGFGERGILRIIVWTAASGGTMEDAIDRLRVKMPARMESLHFPLSREIASGEYEFVERFITLLENSDFRESLSALLP